MSERENAGFFVIIFTVSSMIIVINMASIMDKTGLYLIPIAAFLLIGIGTLLGYMLWGKK